MSRRRFLAAVVALTLTACGGGGDAVAPAPKYPDLAGTYKISGTFDTYTAAEAGLSGTIVITQADRNAPGLAGSANVTVTIGTGAVTLTQLKNATANAAGAITFELPPPGSASTWTFTGSMSGTAITGTHALRSVDGAGVLGRFTAMRQ